MYKFGKRSINNLITADRDLIILFNKVIKEYDCSVIRGMRTPEEQFKLYQKGRTTPGPKVTSLDGYKKKSKHNSNPSLAVDVVPYPIDWNDIERFKELSIVVKRIAKELDIAIEWGGDWTSFKDYPHYQLKK